MQLPSWLVLAFLEGITLVSAVQYQTRFRQVWWDDDNWHIINRRLHQGQYQSRMSLANGYLGINVASIGPFFEVDTPINGDNINGWPLFNTRQTFATIAGFFNHQERTSGSNYPWLYQYGGESVISGIPHWSGLVVEANGALLDASVDPDHILDFSSTFDFAAGVHSWGYSWKAGGEDLIKVEYNMFVHKLYVNRAAVQLKLTATRDINVTVYDVLIGDAAVRADFVDKKYEVDSATIWTAVSPNNIGNVTAYVYSTLKGNECLDMRTRAPVPEDMFSNNQSTIAQSVKLDLVAGKTAEVEKYVGAASTDAFPNPQAVASFASIAGASEGYTKLLHSHILEWEEILPKHSVDQFNLPNGTLPIDRNVQEMQTLAVTNPFHMLQNTVGSNAIAAAQHNTKLGVNSIPVCGLGSDCYGGLIFWDAEVWMAPGLQVSHPYSAQQIVHYRVEKFPQAKANIKTAHTSSANKTSFGDGGAIYPWTSGRHGNCTGTGPCFDYEYHINGDIGLSMYNHFAVTGDSEYFKKDLLPIYNAIAHMYSEVLTFNESSGFYVLLNATDPDEYANNVDNAGFTTALIQRHLNDTNLLNSWFGLPEHDIWYDKSSLMRIPVNEDAGIILEYRAMNGSISVKQADIVLIDDILHYETPYSLANLDYYAAKQSLNGPGMTYGVFSIVANEISPSGCSSYTYDLYGSQPYARAPWFQFSEQLFDEYDSNGGTHPAFPFLTGMGAANRVSIFGYLGLRLFIDRLDIDPSLPPQIPYLNYRTFYWQGHGINAISNATHTIISRMDPEKFTLPNANSTYTTSPIPVTLGNRPGTFELTHNTSLTITNRNIGAIKTVSENILQCEANVQSFIEYLPGQFPLAAIDGAASTKWQPAFANQTAWLFVDLGSKTFYPIREILLDWGTSPPLSYQVVFSNKSFPPFSWNTDWSELRNVTSSTDVEISEPWDENRVFVVEPYVGNQTNITLSEAVWTGRYVSLGIEGNKGSFRPNATGATVAEWSLVKEDPHVPSQSYIKQS
ncbi:carbohydrate-binding module family 32 protein [Amniculicola lignicola CBS 123094]|uniref:alpha,alpha-trehalase n=1 Tax=Amniculicola lignicola CBS 123094 TaxID=1392246 RepID=A0A6A5X0X8_9PLEO|nr:carbohydrate-binding module family 32 protein [Amniculicola lignicola CBS 123094]